MPQLNFASPIPQTDWTRQLSYWLAHEFSFLAYFNGNQYQYPEGNFERIFFAGNTPLDTNQIWQSDSRTKVGIIGYEFKNKIESLESLNPPILDLPETCFFEAELIIKEHQGQIWSNQKLPSEFWENLTSVSLPSHPPIRCEWTPQITKEQYIKSVQSIQDQILEGETYEMNFCQAYIGNYEKWDPIGAYFRLNEISPMPFSSLQRSGLYQLRQRDLSKKQG